MKEDHSNRIPDTLVNELRQYSAGYLSTAQFGMLLELLKRESETKPNFRFAGPNLSRILSAMYEKATLLREAIRYPQYIELLITISSNSNYLTDILVRNPEYFYWIANPSILNSFPEEKSLQTEVDTILLNYKSFNAKLNALKSLKRREILRIGTKDLMDQPPLEMITRQLSITAKILLSSLFRICYEETINKYSLRGKRYKYCVISLGKLGGAELNYSSDVDLMVLYEKNAATGKNKYFEEVLTEVVQFFIDSASKVTDTGYLYRTDFRLRPDGKNSPLCRSLTEYFEYYESRGEDWERQMLIKADFLTGDEILYMNFIDYITPFIYPSSFNSSPLDKIRNLKENIEKNLRNEDNIKLIPGGIRDIEFTIQALQLITGGKNPELRTQNTLEAINRLKSCGLLKKKEHDILRYAYIFFRRIEHYLQLMNDTQTHSIPPSGEILIKLSSYSGFKRIEDFRKEVDSTRQKVQSIKNSVFRTNVVISQGKIRIEEINFINTNRSLKNYRFISEGRGLIETKKFDSMTVDAFRKIEPVIIKYLKNCSSPDNTLENFARIATNISFPSLWYKQFKSYKYLFSFLKICEYSRLCTELLVRNESVRENFITGKFFERILPEKLSTENLIFLLAFKSLNKKIQPETVSVMLKRHFFHKIKLYYNEIFGNKNRSHLVAALGSSGSGEMTFKSDIDLIFVSDSILSPEVTDKFIKLLKRLKKEFYPFDTDCRLRPEGKSSQLVWQTSAYSNYILNRARTWELQSLCKISYVAGNKKILSDLSGSVHKRLKAENSGIIRLDLIGMRKKLYPRNIASIINLKRGRGGLLDIEFVFQYLILTCPELYPGFRGKSKWFIIKRINNLHRKKFSVKLSAEHLNLLCNIIFANQIIFDSGGEKIPVQPSNRKILAEFAGFTNEEKMIKEITTVLNQINNVFQKVFSD